MVVSLESSVLDQLNTKEARDLHEIINQLSSCGVGKIVNLPQIIVVGEQSSGKSSVLEAITRVRFPVRDNVCTRFATEFVLRRGPKSRIDVTIRFADASKPPKTSQWPNFGDGDLTEIISNANKDMGLAATGREFSKDVLRLEIEGPNVYPLTLVDLPGLFHVETENQSQSGKNTVEEVVDGYVREQNSLILVVITASNQLANHIALHKVKVADPKRERTIGVITKPDLARPGYADERTYLQVAKNQENSHKLKLGWHVLRNRAEDELSLEERDTKEDQFFESTAWNSLPPQDRGITALRKKLSAVLLLHIRRNIHGVLQDIESNLADRKIELDQLGMPRAKPEGMRSFLLPIASEFQRLARDGIQGRYADPFFGDLDEPGKKIRAQVRNYNKVFDRILKDKGSKFGVVIDEGSARPSRPILSNFLASVFDIYSDNSSEPEIVTFESLSVRLQEQSAINQGCEFPGLPNHDLVIKLFQDMASPWEDIARFHIDMIMSTAKAFVYHIFHHIAGSPDANQTNEAILCDVDEFFAEKETVLQDKLHELLTPYKSGFSMPLDDEFQKAMETKSLERVGGVLDTLIRQEVGRHGDKDSKESSPSLRSADLRRRGDGDYDGDATERIIYTTLVYYEMSLRTFTENVINLALENCLIRDIPDILSPTKVGMMSDEKLATLAAESEESRARRLQLKQEIEILQPGLQKCRKLRLRPNTHVAAPTTSQPSTLAAREIKKSPAPELLSSKPNASIFSSSPTPPPTTVKSEKPAHPSSPSAPPVPSLSNFGSPLPDPGQALWSPFGHPSNTSTTAVPSSISSGGLFGLSAKPSSTAVSSSTSRPSGGPFGLSAKPSSTAVSSSTSSQTGGLFGSPAKPSSTAQPQASGLAFSFGSPPASDSGFKGFGSPQTSSAKKRLQ